MPERRNQLAEFKREAVALASRRRVDKARLPASSASMRTCWASGLE